jgi:hypothetical protein
MSTVSQAKRGAPLLFPEPDQHEVFGDDERSFDELSVRS